MPNIAIAPDAPEELFRLPAQSDAPAPFPRLKEVKAALPDDGFPRGSA